MKVPYDAVIFLRDELLLSKRLMGLFQPGEWKAFLATNLLYRSRLTRQLLSGMLVRIFLPFVVIVVGVQLFDKFLASQYEFLRVDLLLPLSFGYMLVAFISLARHLKRVWFDFDEKAAQLVGRENMLAALRKLEPLESEKRAKFSRMGSKPTIAARLGRLQQVQTP